MLLSIAVGESLGSGGDATLEDRVVLGMLVRLSVRWCGFGQRCGLQRYYKQQWSPWSSAGTRVPKQLRLNL